MSSQRQGKVWLAWLLINCSVCLLLYKLNALSQEGQVHKTCRRCSLTACIVCDFQDIVRYIRHSPLACNLQMDVSDHLPCDRQLCLCVSTFTGWPCTVVVSLCNYLITSSLHGCRLAYLRGMVNSRQLRGDIYLHLATLLMTCPDAPADMACMQPAMH